MNFDADQAKNYSCEFCGFYGNKLSNLLTHISTRKHKNSMKFNEKKCGKYFCKLCNIFCDTVTILHIHNLSVEHKIKINEDNIDVIKYNCDICNKEYKTNNSLWYHKKRCIKDKDKNGGFVEQLSGSSIILNLIKENNDFKNLMLEQMKDTKEQIKENKEQQKENKELINKMVEITQNQISTVSTINSNNTINNNQKFNLNFFLNETCKDAMTIQEFLDSIRITFEDLLLIGNTGFVNGVSDILIKQLRDMEVSKRPIHCTDSKRDTIYLKENAAWNRDDKDKTRLKQIIEKIEYRNVVALRDWCNENPDVRVNNTPNNILKDKIYLQTLQGDDKTRDKIIKNISKEVMVEKE